MWFVKFRGFGEVGLCSSGDSGMAAADNLRLAMVNAGLEGGGRTSYLYCRHRNGFELGLGNAKHDSVLNKAS